MYGHHQTAGRPIGGRTIAAAAAEYLDAIIRSAAKENNASHEPKFRGREIAELGTKDLTTPYQKTTILATPKFARGTGLISKYLCYLLPLHPPNWAPSCMIGTVDAIPAGCYTPPACIHGGWFMAGRGGTSPRIPTAWWSDARVLGSTSGRKTIASLYLLCVLE